MNIIMIVNFSSNKTIIIITNNKQSRWLSNEIFTFFLKNKQTNKRTEKANKEINNNNIKKSIYIIVIIALNMKCFFLLLSVYRWIKEEEKEEKGGLIDLFIDWSTCIFQQMNELFFFKKKTMRNHTLTHNVTERGGETYTT